MIKTPQFKSLAKALFTFYILFLLWLVLFKFSFDVLSILNGHQMRELNLVPFVSSLRSEAISNLVVFIPFGLLLSVNLKQVSFWTKLAIICVFSLAVEIFQFALAIGVTDITDVIMNTAGGFVGLMLYILGDKYTNTKNVDRFIIIAGAILLILFILLRLLVFKVQY